MEDYKKLQEELLKKTKIYHRLSEPVIEAYYHYPRHEFVPENYSIEDAYRDSALELYQKGRVHSTISQPSFVLYLLELLNIEEGQKIFEVGTGSGWNAALMSYLTGPTGLVVTMEIIPEIAQKAIENLYKHGIQNVQVIEGDAAWGWAEEAPYDRMIFTAATKKRPPFLLEQCRDGGRVLFVQEGDLGHDEMQVLEKRGAEFKCLKRVPCYFVSMTGAADSASHTPSAKSPHNPPPRHR